MDESVDRQDTKRALVHHMPSGERYIVEIASVWRDQECVGSRIIAAKGPIYYGDLLPTSGPVEPSVELFDRIDAWQDLTDQDADWLQGEEDAGRLTYPIGLR